jgi:hypothetical protein
MKKLILVILFVMVAGAAYAEKVQCCKTVCTTDPWGKQTCTTECKMVWFCN